MSFSIGFIDEQSVEHRLQGRITIGNFSEQFEASLSFWCRDDYIKQWKNGLVRLADGEYQSCLITSMYDPSTANFIIRWNLYRDKCAVHVQNSLLILDDIQGALNPSDPYSHIPERRLKNEYGQKISEWSTTLDAIRLNLSKWD